jgi:ABC-type branched-subunit amino acid transport system ATPase component/branched-subunit amino acid ABC-type transport system permease component
VLPFIVAGLTTGSVYGLAGVGLVLTYKTSRVFNFAHGALATVSAFLFYTLHVRHGVPWPVAAIVCLILAGPGLGLVFEFIARVLTGSSLAVRVASTVGALLIVQAAVTLIYGTTATRQVPPFLGNAKFRIGSTILTQDKLTIWVIAFVATAGLYLFFRFARNGMAMRAVVDNPELLDLAGTSPTRVRRWSWAIGVTFAAASGLLLAPLINLDGTTLTLLIVQAFGAAAIGAFTSLPLTYVGGLAIGVAASLATKYFTHGFWAGLPAALPFLVLFVVLLVAPKRRLAERAPVIPRQLATWTAPARVQLLGGGVLVVFLLFVPSFAGIHLDDWTTFLAGIIIFLSLGLLVRTSGQVSLCQISFTAIGAAAFSHLAVGRGLPWLVALLLAGLIAVPIGALLAIPAIRLSGLYLALATFGFGIFLSYMFYSQTYMFGHLNIGLTEPRPHLSWLNLDSDKGYYYLVLVMAIIATALVVFLVRSRLGRLLRALADSPNGLATGGTSIQVTRVLVFCISAFLAAVGGALAASAVSTVTADSYQPLTSLTLFALIIIVVGGAPWYAVLAAGGLYIIPSYLTSPNTSTWLSLLFGLSALLYALTPPAMRGVPATIASALDRFRRKPRAVTPTAVAVGTTSTVTPATLQVDDLRVTFGGLVAVDDVNLRAQTGRITGLIGPNGAGKTTTFNACCGLNSPSRGRIDLDGTDLRHRGAAVRARRGLGRTFQQMELYDSMTVRENVELGYEASLAGPNALTHLVAAPQQRRRAAGRATDAIERCGLSALADRPVSSLSTGQRRLVELARCLAGPFRVLLLDEPSSGLDRAETEEFARILRDAVRDHGLGVLIVEHDMQLVTGICDHIYVLDFGKLIFEGSPSEVMASPVVQAAYLGAPVGGVLEAAVGEERS